MTGKKREEGEEYKFLASYVTLNLCVTKTFYVINCACA
jgi:hypothetical protein